MRLYYIFKATLILLVLILEVDKHGKFPLSKCILKIVITHLLSLKSVNLSYSFQLRHFRTSKKIETKVTLLSDSVSILHFITCRMH